MKKRKFIRIFLLISILVFQVMAVEPDYKTAYKSISRSSLYMYWFNPKHQSSNPYPVAVFFHGGGWKKGKPKQFYRYCRGLSNYGIKTVSVEYRTLKRFGTSPEKALEDAKSAIRWIRKNSEKLNIDPNKIVAIGASAGGQLALATSVIRKFNSYLDDVKVSSKPNALILINPVIDNGPGGYGYQLVKNYWKDFSPMEHLDQPIPPTMIMSGDMDRIVRISTLKKFQSKVIEQNGRCDLIIVEGAKHGFFRKKKYFNRVLKEMLKFLESIGYIEKDFNRDAIFKKGVKYGQ